MVVIDGGCIRIDLHVHTVFSDGMETPESMVARAKALHLDGIAITDHDSIAGWERAFEAGRHLGIAVIPGKEIRIRHGPRVVGEVLALFLNEDVKKNQITALGELIDEIHEQGGIAAVPHPFDWARKSLILNFAEKHRIKFDAIESINGRNDVGSNARGMEWAHKREMPQIGGSDAHLLREVGEAYTFCETPGKNVEAFRKAILHGHSKPIGIQKHPARIFYDRMHCRLKQPFRKR